MSVPLSRRRAGARNGARLAEAAIADELARQRAEAEATHAASVERRKAEREAERARPKLARAALEGAEFIRTDTGWHRVVRINATTATVATAYSWTDRIPFARVLEVRHRKPTD